MDLKGEIYKKQEYEDNHEKETELEMDKNVTQKYRMETKELSSKRIKLDVDIESPLMPNNNRVNI